MRTKTGPRWLRVLGVLAVLSLVLVACGGDSDDDGNDGAAPEEGSDQPESEIDPNGVIRAGYDLVSSAKGGFRWDPATQSTSLTDSGVFGLVYGNLLRKTKAGELVPDLAESTEVVDANTIEITLREGLTFSDGTPFDAEAVKAGLERNLAEGDPAGFSNIFFALTAVEAVDVTTVRLTIPDGTAPSWHDTFLGSWETTIVHPGLDFEKPIGAGPMMITSYVTEQSVTLAKNPGYWDADSVLPAGIELVHVPTSATPTAGPNALRAGQVDMVAVPTSEIKALGDGLDYLLEVDPTALVHLSLCKRDEPLSDARVRRALTQAIDRETISEVVFNGAYVPAYGLWPEGHRFHDSANEEGLAYDVESAKALLEEAGYAEGFELDAHTLNAGNMPEMIEVVQQMFTEIGVTLNIVPAPNIVADFLGAQVPGLAPLPTMGAGRGKLRSWTGDAIGNTCKYDDPELNELQEQLTQVSDADPETAEIWHQIEKNVATDNVLTVFILFGASPYGYDTATVGDPAVTADFLPVPDVRRSYIKAG